MAGFDSEALLQMNIAGMNFAEIEDRFKECVSEDIWHEFIRKYCDRIEYSVGYYARKLAQTIVELRKLGYSDEQIAFLGRFEFTDPHGDTVRLRGI